jgi:CBS domain-containing protein
MTFPAPVIGHWMSTTLITIAPDKGLEEAREAMHDARIRHLPVVDAEGTLGGILSNRDIDRHGDTSSTVEAAMTPLGKVHTADAYESVRAAAELLCREKISALPVLQGKKLVGIVTTEDLLWALLQEETHAD